MSILYRCSRHILEHILKMSSSSNQNGHWSKGLLGAMNDPNAIIDEDPELVTIKDKYPKVDLSRTIRSI